LSKSTITPYDEYIFGFSGERIDTQGYIDMYTKFEGRSKHYMTIKVRYIIMGANTSYNVLLE